VAETATWQKPPRAAWTGDAKSPIAPGIFHALPMRLKAAVEPVDARIPSAPLCRSAPCMRGVFRIGGERYEHAH